MRRRAAAVLSAAKRGVPTHGDAWTSAAERWAGSAVAVGAEGALGKLGLRPGERPGTERVGRVLQGRHADTGAQVRATGQLGAGTLAWLGSTSPASATGVAHVEVRVPLPEAAAEAWAAADERQRGELAAAFANGALAGAERLTAAPVAAVAAVRVPGGSADASVDVLLLGVDKGGSALASPAPKRDFSRRALQEAAAAAEASIARSLESSTPAQALADAPAGMAVPESPVERRAAVLGRSLGRRPTTFVQVELVAREAMLAERPGRRVSHETEARVLALRGELARRGEEQLTPAATAFAASEAVLEEQPVRLFRARVRELQAAMTVPERAPSGAGRRADRGSDRAWLTEQRERLGDPFKRLLAIATAVAGDAERARPEVMTWWRESATDAAKVLALEERLAAIERVQEVARLREERAHEAGPVEERGPAADVGHAA